MTPTPEQIDAVAEAICDAEFWPGMWATLSDGNERSVYQKSALAAINVMRPLIRAESLEEAANIIERLTYRKRFIYAKQNNEPIAPCEYAAAIRALKERP